MSDALPQLGLDEFTGHDRNYDTLLLWYIYDISWHMLHKIRPSDLRGAIALVPHRARKITRIIAPLKKMF
jgi:hypothetical protein